ncbi:hypothetical protein Trydic_g8778 [Trypoxylus dichotomus]
MNRLPGAQLLHENKVSLNANTTAAARAPYCVNKPDKSGGTQHGSDLWYSIRRQRKYGAGKGEASLLLGRYKLLKFPFHLAFASRSSGTTG